MEMADLVKNPVSFVGVRRSKFGRKGRSSFAYLKKRAIYFTIERASAILEKSMNKKVSGYLKSQLLPTVIYCWNVGGRIPDLNQPHWSVDIDSNPSSIYREYMNKFARSYHGFTYDEAEKWLSETLIKLDLNQ